MKINRIVITIIVALIAVIITTTLILNSNGDKIKIEGQIIGSNSQMIYIEQSMGSKRHVIDSTELSAIGEFRISIKKKSDDPSLYELRCGWERVPILANRGDRIYINSLGRLSLNYIVEGSEESELLREFYQPYVRHSEELKRISSKYALAKNQGEDITTIAKEYNTTYNTIKREQLKFIINNKSSLASVYALFQRLPGDTYLINESSDVIYMRTIAESIAEVYPTSAYLDVINRTIKRYDDSRELSSKVAVRNYPEIVLPNALEEEVALSSLDGSLILVDFWSTAHRDSNANNADLKELYLRYQPEGFEVYQIGIETSKALWIETIHNQRLPWISVSDLQGDRSPVLGIYNITTLPANYLISKDGEIIGRDLYGDKLKSAIEQHIK